MKLKKYTLDDFSDGFIADRAEDTMELSQTPYLSNVDTVSGSMKTVNGSVRYIDDDIVYNEKKYYPLIPMVYYGENVEEIGTDMLVVPATDSASVRMFTHFGTEWKNLGINASYGKMDYINCVYNNMNKLIMCNEYDGLYKFDVAENKIEWIEDSPAMSAITLHYERVWGINKNTVYYSAQGDPEEWNEENSDSGKIVITTADGDNFVAIENIFDDVVLFRKNSIFRINGSTTSAYQLKQILSPCGAAGSMCVANDGIHSFFIGKNGIYKFDGLRAELIEKNILRYFFEKRVNISALENACAKIYNNKLYAALPIDECDYNNCILEYDITTGKVHIREGISALSFTEYASKLLYTDNNGYICMLDMGKDYCGKKIKAVYETPYCDLDGKNIEKALESIYFVGKGNGSIRITSVSDQRAVSKEVVLSNDDMKIYTVEMYNSGRRFKFIFENVDGSSFEIMRPEILFEEYGED